MTTTIKFNWIEFAAALRCQNVRDEGDAAGRVQRILGALGYMRPCNRCGGSGQFSRNSFGQTHCYDCGGRGEYLRDITPAIVAEASQRVAAGELDAWRAANRARAAEKQAAEAARAARVAAWEAEREVRAAAARAEKAAQESARLARETAATIMEW